MQFQVPQFIETEDKIVGPLSLRQFIYIAIAGAASALLYFILQTWLWVIFTIIFVGGAIAIAFIKIEGRPLAKIIMSAFNFYWNPQIYVWQPEHTTIERSVEPSEKPKKMIKPVGGISLEKIAQGLALHKSWEGVQTGEKISAKQLTEQKMYGRYEIFQKRAGDKDAARRVDYR